MSRRPSALHDERGETLVEVLVALVILGIAAVAILAGLQLSVTTSDIHRKQTTGGAYARSYAEAIERYVAAGNYVKCAPAGTYTPSVVGFDLDLPPRFAGTQAAAQRVPPDGGPAGSCSVSNDTGVLQLDIAISSDDGRATERLTVLLRRPCDTPASVQPAGQCA